MNLLAEITEKDLGIGETEILGGSYELRKSARAILLDETGKMATQYLNTYKYHKLPGGGIEVAESVENALRREVLEEVGCDCEIISEVGITIEYRNQWKFLHISKCFVAEVVGMIGETTLEDGEIEEGQETLWMAPEEVLHKMKSDSPEHYQGHFILEREKSFLTEYLKTIK